MTHGERVAQRLAALFMENGSFAAAVPMSGFPGWDALPAAARPDDLLDSAFEEAGFAGLSVQAVGHEVGAGREKVHVYVTRGSRSAVRTLETSRGGVPVEINRVGRLVVRPDQANAATHRGNLYLRDRRVACGSSCAPSGENYSGTFGALVRKRGGGNALYVLSNNHVLGACNHTPVGQPILAPGNSDASPGRRAPGEIARHAEICELRSGVPALVDPCEEDVALARVPDPAAVSSWQGDDETGYDTPTATAGMASGMRVKKVGRTTGLTAGRVESRIGTLLCLPYKTRYFTATVWFRNVWAVVGEAGAPFALAGDSGSLVVTDDGRRAVGLVFAVSGGEYAFVLPMDRLASRFGGIRLVGGHGT